MKACQFDIEVATPAMMKSRPASIFKWAGIE
jgi:hypothetical protein